jgi:pilus assembly protein CpaE
VKVVAQSEQVTRLPTAICLTGICENLPELREELEQAAEVSLVAARERLSDAFSLLQRNHIQVLLHATPGPALPRGEIEEIRKRTKVPILLLTGNGTQALLDEALEADVEDVLVLPLPVESVVYAIRRAGRSGARAAGAVHQGLVVTVFSPKGGTGKTVVATNLAASLAKHEEKRTLLVDLDLQFGDAAIMLGLEPEKTIADLVSAPGELDPEKLAGYTARHSSGLELLAAPLRPEDAELVTEPKLERLLEVARSSYDAIVIDTSPSFSPTLLATLDRTDELVLVCGPEVPALKNVHLSLQTLGLLTFPPERIVALLNHPNGEGLSRGEIEGALDVKIRHDVPHDRGVPPAVNRGNPAVLVDGKGAFSREIRKLAKELQPVQPRRRKRRRWLARA